MRWSIQMFWWCVAPNDPAQVTEDIIAEWFAIRNRSAFGEEVRTSVSPQLSATKCVFSVAGQTTHPTGWMSNAAGWTSWCKNLTTRTRQPAIQAG